MNQSSNKSNNTNMAQGTQPRANRTIQVLRPLRPSNQELNNTTRIPRHLFRSQIPIRARMEMQTAQRAAARSLADTQNVVQSVETAFSVYGERLQADFRDFRALCTTLVAQEHEEKERWHDLCLRIMKERDAARQRVQFLLGSKREPSPTAVAPACQTRTAEPSSSRGSKRAREDINTTIPEDTGAASPKLDPRPMCSLRTPSPPGSPPAYSPTSLPPPPPRSPASAPPSSGTSSAPACITTFHTPRSRSASEEVEHLASEHQPPPKRRKSCDSSFSRSSSTTSTLVDAPTGGSASVKPRPRTQSPVVVKTELPSLPKPLVKPTPGICPPGDFSHVDIMYLPVNGKLVCRACQLNSAKQPAQEPKAFPTNASWDDLRDHCITEHPAACVDVARLHPAEIFELRRRLNM